MSEPNRTADNSIVTIRIQRAYLYAALGLVLGFIVGVAATKAFFPREVGVAQAQVGSTSTTTATNAVPAGPVDVDISGRPMKGAKDAKVTVVEFTDYQCPFCKRHFDEVLTPLLEKHGDDIRYVVRNFPIATLHTFAQKAAEAAECAFEQNKFWEYHDALFANQDKLDEKSLEDHAKKVGLDTNEFGECLDSDARSGIVKKDVDDATRYGVTGTPTFFINGEMVKGAIPLSAFDASIARHLKD